MDLQIELAGQRDVFHPGETVRGTFSWSLSDRPSELELRLFWYTQSKGTQDVTIVTTRRLDLPPMAGRETFEFQLPDGPYTMHGKLISVLWALELVAGRAKETARTPLVLSPYDGPVVLDEPQAGNTGRPTP